MTIIFHIDDFLFDLFPVEKNNVEELKDFLKRFYTEGPFEPTIEIKDGLVKIQINVSRISEDKLDFQNLINLCEKKQFTQAKLLAENLIKKSPNVSEYHRILGQILSDEGNPKEAVNCLIDALRWNPKNEWALIMMGNIYARDFDDIETAMRYYDQVVKINPKDNISLNNIGANLLRQGKYDEALKYFNSALSIDPSYPNTYVGMGMLFEQRKEYTKAFESFISGLKVHKTNDEMRNHLLGNAYGVSEKVIQSDLPEILVGVYKQKLEKKGNRTISIEQDPDIPTAAKIEFAENYNRPNDVVKYNPKYPAYQHLIMHELVHLELLLEARSNNENQLFISDGANKEKFKEKLKPYISNLVKKGLPTDSIDLVVEEFFQGLNRQIFNAAPDLFIEDRLYSSYPDLKPIQFVSLFNMIQEGIKAVTKKEIIEIADPWVLSTSKIFNLLNAIQLNELFGVDLSSKFNASQVEFNQAKRFYSEFLEYREDKLPAEEFELTNNWAIDLGLKDFFSLVNEHDFRNNSALDILNNIEQDPFDLKSDSTDKDVEMQEFLKSQENLGTNIAVTMYMVEAMNYFRNINPEKIKEIAFEIAMQGSHGYNPDSKYRLHNIPSKSFTGYQILAYYYVSWAIAIPEMLKELKLPYDSEYQLAKQLFK